jgi:magnesium transporter
MKERTRTPASPPAVPRAGSQPRQVEHAGLIWLDIIGPTAAHVSQLRERYAFDALVLEDVLSQTQRPKLDSYIADGYLFAVLQFPVLDRSQRISGAAEVDLFVGRDYIITLHDGSLRSLRRMFTAAGSDEHARAQLMGRGPGYLLYRIADALIKQTFPMVDALDDELARTEEQVFGQGQRQAVRALAELRRDIVAFRHIVGPNLAVARALESGDTPFLRVPASYFGDLADGLEALMAIAEEQRETAAGLQAALDSTAIQQMHAGIRLLTIVALVLLPMILIAAIFGMNLALPFTLSPLAFPIVVLAMLAIAVGVVAYVRYQRWI